MFGVLNVWEYLFYTYSSVKLSPFCYYKVCNKKKPKQKTKQKMTCDCVYNKKIKIKYKKL